LTIGLPSGLVACNIPTKIFYALLISSLRDSVYVEICLPTWYGWANRDPYETRCKTEGEWNL